MQNLKFSRLMTLVTIFVVALLAAACSPAASTPTTAPGTSGDNNATTIPGDTATTAPSGGDSDAAGDPAAAAKSFFDALLSGGDPAAFVCATAADAQAVQDGYAQMAAAYAAAKIDASGLTYTASNVTADTASVAIGGNLSVDTAGVKTNVPFEVPAVALKNEDGAWKIC